MRYVAAQTVNHLRPTTRKVRALKTADHRNKRQCASIEANALQSLQIPSVIRLSHQTHLAEPFS